MKLNTSKWNRQPPPYKGKLRKGCIWALIPGWGVVSGEDGAVWSHGQNPRKFIPDTGTGGSTGTQEIVRQAYGGGIRDASALELRPNSSTTGKYLVNRDDDLGIVFPDKEDFTILAIVKPNGDGLPTGGGDPRIFMKGTTWNSGDHDLMIGMQSAGTARSRVRVAGVVYTQIPTGNLQSNALNLIAGGLKKRNPTFNLNFPFCAILREDGTYNETSATGLTGSYDPRTTTDIGIGSNSAATSQFFDGDIIGIWAFDHSLNEQELREFFANPWAVHDKKITFSDINPPGGGTVAGSVVFNTTLNKLLSKKLSANKIITLSTEFDKVNQNTKISNILLAFNNILGKTISNTKTTYSSQTFDLLFDHNFINTRLIPVNINYNLIFDQILEIKTLFNKSINFDLTLDQLNTINKIIEESKNFEITLDKVQVVNAILSTISNLDIQLDIEELNSRIINETIVYNLTLDQLQALQGIVDAAINFGFTLEQLNILKRIINSDQNFDLTISELTTVNKATSILNTFNIDLNKAINNTLDKQALFIADINLNYVSNNQAILVKKYFEQLFLDKSISNYKISNNNIYFNTLLDSESLINIVADLTISFDTDLTVLQQGSTASIIQASIQFLTNLGQTQNNQATLKESLDIILNLAEEQNVQLDKVEVLALLLQVTDDYKAARGLFEQEAFNVVLDESYVNTANKIGIVAFNVLIDQLQINTGSTLKAIVDLASTFTFSIFSEGEPEAEITYGLMLNQDLTKIQKTTSTTMGFNVVGDVIKQINLVVEGNINLSTILNQTELQKRIVQSNITFGHILGLASINSANLEADLLLGIIQDIKLVGSTLEFVIVSPDRKIKVFIENRIIFEGEENRTILVKRTR